jgi:hypothetical protein
MDLDLAGHRIRRFGQCQLQHAVRVTRLRVALIDLVPERERAVPCGEFMGALIHIKIHAETLVRSTMSFPVRHAKEVTWATATV